MKPLNVEIILKTQSHISRSSITSITRHYLESTKIRSNTVITQFDNEHHPILHSEAKAIIIEEIPDLEGFINFSQYEINWYVYTLDINGPVCQIEEGDGEGEGQLNIATHLMLPSAHVYNLWENLYYDNNIKQNLLKYAQTMMEFSDRGVDTNIVNCNRVILLHGPPGTGKTSLCKALAHKLSIRMQERYTSGVLIEINSHSLFSKWFSESGKLVTKMFSKIIEIVENSNLLVCVLIDEIESLAHARNQCVSGNEPSDSIRVVNAVLTQIDRIKRYSNVLILTTSNITESIDLAFIDRADIKQYLGLPTPTAICKVYHSCIEELIKAQVIKCDEVESNNKEKLWEICEKSQGLSGRSLRKIPFIAHALYLEGSSIDLGKFLAAMLSAIEREKKERQYFEK
ncbi:pachytene checkpoint protein 2 homolog [Tribolium madens]|uniref:pachytene checkpoint protein 2 homolog n=1 Tax=Tribolium madens TaxID=41895 RepID=UPI001CF76142|nr:pachytene checkpoint protein 2 homolog [Tribolium madens]